MMEASAEFAFVGRVALAAVIGFIIGWERERRGSQADDRTYALVCLGAATVISLGKEYYPATTGHVVQGVIIGIGFLGSGMIFRNGTKVSGLTTAAGFWATAAVGLVIGSGEYIVGILIAVLIFLVLEWEEIPYLNKIGHITKDTPDPPPPGKPG